MEQKATTQGHYSGWKFRVSIAGVAILALAGLWFIFNDDSASLPDFSRFDQTGELKQAFFSYLEPIIQDQNDAVRKQRARLQMIARRYRDAGDLGLYHRWRLNRLAAAYAVPENLDTETKIQTLLLRIDVVPLELAAVQAAKESAWGRSRFAVRANNLFGHWCFDPGCGLVPRNRIAGRNHELKAYDSVAEAIAGYMFNLNTHPRYLQFRQLRARSREAEERLSGVDLADGLLHYSERREAYVREIKAMIRQYREFAAETEGNIEA